MLRGAYALVRDRTAASNLGDLGDLIVDPRGDPELRGACYVVFADQLERVVAVPAATRRRVRDALLRSARGASSPHRSRKNADTVHKGARAAMSDEDDDYVPARSTDGSDSEGSLRDFIVDSDDDEDVATELHDDDDDAAGAGSKTVSPMPAGPDDTAEEARELIRDFPYDPALLEMERPLIRRSARASRPVVRYVDPEYRDLVLRDGDVDLDEVFCDAAAGADADDDDDDDDESYVMSDMSDGADTDSGEMN